MAKRALIRPVGHLLPFYEREKAKLLKIIAFSRVLAWEKVAEGRMRALRLE